MNELNVCSEKQKEAEVEKEGRSKHHYICLFFITFRTFFSLPGEFPVSALSTIKNNELPEGCCCYQEREKKNVALLLQLKSKIE